MFIADPDFAPERIKALRTRLGLTQAEFGARLGISQKAISSWEINGVPKRYMAVVKLLELERKSARVKKVTTIRGPRRQPRWR